MAQQNTTFKPPLSIIILDAIGSIFLGLGLAKMFAGVDLLSKFIPFDKNGWTLIIIGAVLMLPMLLHLLAKIRERAEQKLIQ